MNGAEIYKFKAKVSEIVSGPLCLGKISKDWSTDYMKKTGFNGYVYDFSVDYYATDVDDIVDIHRVQIRSILYSSHPINCRYFFVLAIT